MNQPEPKSKRAWKIVAALVLLRLVVGWHFFQEGTKKLSYDPGRNEWQVDFSADGFFTQAKGPLAGLIKSQLPGMHDWQSLLAVPKQALPLSAEADYQRADGLAEYNQSRKAAIKAKEPVPFELPPFAPYHDWAKRVIDDWEIKLKAFTDLKGLGVEQKAEAAERFQLRRQQLADFLADEFEAIEDYQHDLWRLEQKKSQAGATEIPFRRERLEKKQAETAQLPNQWIAGARRFEQELEGDLRSIASSGDAAWHEAIESAITSPKEKRMRFLSLAVTCVVTGVGVCLLLGFFTRLASVVGALFLFSVIATQPPWIVDAAPTMFQIIELAALLVLAATAAGRYAGLDFFTHAFWQKCCGGKKSITQITYPTSET